MNCKDIFMKTEQFGDLCIYDVLLNYIYPRVFVCEDEFGCKYLFYEMENQKNIDIWFVTKLSQSTYYDLIDKKISIQKVYSKSKIQNLYEIKKIYGDGDNNDTVEVNVGDNKWISELPKDEVFSEKDVF